jgi:hypothetical protein
MKGVADPLAGQEAVKSTPGPMAHSPEDLDLVMKTYLDSEPWRLDPAVLKMPWTSSMGSKQKFCFVIAYGDELVSQLSTDELCLTDRLGHTPSSDIARSPPCCRKTQGGRTYGGRMARSISCGNDDGTDGFNLQYVLPNQVDPG